MKWRNSRADLWRPQALVMPKALATLTRQALQRILDHLKENGACIYQTDEYGDDVIGPIDLGNQVEFTIKQLAERAIDLTNSKFSNENPKRPAAPRAIQWP